MDSAVICSAAQLLEPNANALPLASVVNKKTNGRLATASFYSLVEPGGLNLAVPVRLGVTEASARPAEAPPSLELILCWVPVLVLFSDK